MKELQTNVIHNVDCLTGLKELEDNSIDAIVTDPPYGLEFMGKEWDKFSTGRGAKYKSGGELTHTEFKKLGTLPQYVKRPAKRCKRCGKQAWSGSPCKCKEPEWELDNSVLHSLQEFCYKWATECLRILKPGGHLLSFGGTRTYHRMAVAIEDAGFEVRDMLEWIYASGFPKSLNVGKAVDKICGETGRKEKFTEFMRATGMTANEINKITNTFMGSHYLTNKEQPAIPTAELWAKLRPHIKIEIPQWVDELVERIEREREVIGINKNCGTNQSDGESMFGIGAVGKEVNITKGNSEWEGFGTALKPAHEPIILARKPLSEKTIVENVLKHGTGAIDIDGCRIPTSEDLSVERSGDKKLDTNKQGWGFKAVSRGNEGRFPANIICSDDALNDGVMTKSGSGIKQLGGDKINPSGWKEVNRTKGEYLVGDSGSKSRYFDIDVWAEKHGLLQFPKASKRERNEGCEGLEEKEKDTKILPNRKCLNCGEWENKGAGNGVDFCECETPEFEDKTIRVFKNHHPTVKPVHLMAWLIRLVSKEGDTVLDPFTGSGTTGVACKKLGRNFIGMELSKEYCEIAEKRISGVITQQDLFRSDR